MNQVQNNLSVKVPNGQTLFQFIKKEDLKKTFSYRNKEISVCSSKKKQKKKKNFKL